MKIINNNKKRVKILIGETERGYNGIHKPTRSIILIETTVDEVYDKIIEVLKNEK